ncbi:MAG: GGDEF domain-containing protein [Lachnospiraceae bacterium]|nr:GGDEF domain-containing protein [Lachnospiraceae bacterium]
MSEGGNSLNDHSSETDTSNEKDLFKNTSIIRKIKGFITKDTTVANESTKVFVVIRVLVLSVLFYFLTILCIDRAMHLLDGRGMRLSVLFVAVFIWMFYMTYKLRAKYAAWMFSLGLLCFIYINLQWFGWWIGVQHFLIVILILIFFVGYDGFPFKMGLAAAVTLTRLLFYYKFHAAQAAYPIPSQMGDLLQIINTVAIFWCLSVICYVFSKSTREMEGKLVKYNEQLQRQALTDNLTGLANRRRALDYVEQILSEGQHENFSLCMCDIDFFKKVNDTWGHECGDQVLKAIAKTFKERMPRGSLPCRWGGEEFLLLFPGLNGDEANALLMSIRDKIKKMVVEYEGHEVSVTMTFGLTEFDFQRTIEDAITEADGKLYYGKEHGRDQIVF